MKVSRYIDVIETINTFTFAYLIFSFTLTIAKMNIRVFVQNENTCLFLRRSIQDFSREEQSVCLTQKGEGKYKLL